MAYKFKLKIRAMLWLPVLLVLMGTGGDCDRIQFYAEKNYEGFIEEYDLSGDKGGRCRNFVSNMLDIKSLKTDGCIMLYGNLGCDIHYQHFSPLFQKSDPSYSLRVDADIPEITDALNAGGTQIVHSFGPCSRERGGGPEVDVDFYSDRNYKGKILDTFRDVCGCQNLRRSAVGGKSKHISVDNHGHDIDLFEGKDCTGQMRSVRAGSNWATKWLWPGNDGMAVFDVQSFRPTHSEGCIKLNAAIYNFDLDNKTQAWIDHATEENVEIVTDSIMRNNGDQLKVQELSVSSKVPKEFEVTRSAGHSDMEAVKQRAAMLREGHGNRVQFYGKENYEYFLKEYALEENASTRCQSVDPSLEVTSLKTDRCIILYSRSTECKGFTIVDLFGPIEFDVSSMRIDTDAPTLENLNTSSVSGPFKVSSFNVCSREMGGGPEVDVEFYKEPRYWPPFAYFSNVYGCRNLEKSFVGGKNRPISINNNGNNIDLFEGEHCTGQMITLPAGVSRLSVGFGWPNDAGEPAFDVQSFRPTNYQDRIKLEASIYKFTFKNGTQEMIQGSKNETVKLATDSILRSNGAASLTQEFTVTGKVTTGAEYATAIGFNNMHTVKTEASVETTVETGIPLVFEGEIKTKFTASYQYQRTDTGSTNNKTSVVSEETISTRQVINIPPCTECVVSTFVRKVKNFPIAYSAYSKVTGTAGEEKMSALDVRSALRPDMIYLGDVDGYTVDVMVDGVMFAEFGINSFINADCKPIHDCEIKPNNLVIRAKPYKTTFKHPITYIET